MGWDGMRWDAMSELAVGIEWNGTFMVGGWRLAVEGCGFLLLLLEGASNFAVKLGEDGRISTRLPIVHGSPSLLTNSRAILSRGIHLVSSGLCHHKE